MVEDIELGIGGHRGGIGRAHGTARSPSSSFVLGFGSALAVQHAQGSAGSSLSPRRA